MKKLNRKRSIAALVLVTAMLLTACGGGQTTSTLQISESDKLIEENVRNHVYPFVPEGETIELRTAVGSSPNIADYNTNKFTLFLEERTGIDLVLDIYADRNQKVAMMYATDDPEMPDFLTGYTWSDDQLVKYGVDGEQIIIELGPYMDEYGYYLDETIEKSVIDVEKWLVSSDGRRYFMPQIVEQQGNSYGKKAFINKVWLDKLGLEVPKTTEDLRKVLKAFVTEDPNGNGKADELGITGAKNGWHQVPWHFLINSFTYYDADTGLQVDKKGNVSYVYTKDEFKDALKYINSLIEEGLYDKEAFVNDNSILKTMCQLDDNIIGVVTTGSPDNIMSSIPERMLDYVALPPLEGPEGVAFAHYAPVKALVDGTVTKYCKNPLAAFALMDFMLSEEASIFSRYGEEGPDWRWATKDDVGLFENIGVEAKIVPILPYGSPQNSHWQASGVQFRHSGIADGMAWDGNPLNGEKVKADAITAYYGKGPEKVIEKLLFTPDESEEYADLHASIQTFVIKSVAEFIVGDKDIDKEWDAFQAELDTYNVDRYLELIQAAYDRFEKGGK